ncbi:type I restriction modification DNA specificity domain-containing protein [Bifidobacterium pseudolongum subsp. globosum]|uniref:Type I restriction modification DNA specificity domain-containing protein n=1 Tax=Bifidobacterium pseudolongum subsp. globosum TaxID=1690 RepID=A0A4Q5BC63_9BIFI|nr:type I restriction modification DNA specificity domain-containing protein [Bifidobacterium pseudolongum subsp. globosum]
MIEGGGLQGDLSLRTASTSVFHEHDTLFGRLRPYLRKFWFANTAGVKSGEIWSLYSSALKPEFLYALTQSVQFLNQALQTAGTKMPRAEWKTIAEAYFAVPQAEEQEKIGLLLQKLEKLIAAEKRKLLLLEQKREAYSQKVFSYGSHHEEDVKHWKTMRLGDIATRITRRNKGQSNLPLTISARDGLIDQRQFFSKQVASKNLDNYILLQRGEFAYNKSTSSDSPWGTIKRLDRYDQGCISTLYICFSMHSVDPQFITTLFNSPIWHREIQTIATEGARNHGLLNISPKDFFDIQLQIPDSLSEQKHIGRFFAAYEQLIRQTAKRIGLLEKKKKALLQTMFI